MVDHKVIEKVRKILALAGNNPSQEEAQTALLKAQEILAKHGLAMSDVSSSERSERDVVRHRSTNMQRASWWRSGLHRVISDNFRCGSIINGGRLTFIGFEEDVVTADAVFQFAVSTLAQLAKEYGRRKWDEGYDRSGVNRLKNDYMRGFISGLKQKLAEQVEMNGWGLVLVKDALVVQKFEEITKGRVHGGFKFKRSGDQEAFEEGYEKGRSFEMSGTLVEGKECS